ncbi:MAG: hypothetical protein IPJ69_00090 [Deltaproteobacteria bacterium]|nr:MAG: hypothetical protein IPJ69_00090 [Deltaproteobacteria bacterium]
MAISLLFSLDPTKAAQVYKTIGPDYIQVVTIPQLRSIVRGVTASYEAKALYTSERETISNEMYSHLKQPLRERGWSKVLEVPLSRPFWLWRSKRSSKLSSNPNR